MNRVNIRDIDPINPVGINFGTVYLLLIRPAIVTRLTGQFFFVKILPDPLRFQGLPVYLYCQTTTNNKRFAQ